MAIGLHGQVGVIAQCLVDMGNRKDKEHVINQNVEEKVAMAASTVPRPVILHAKRNVRTFLTRSMCTNLLLYLFDF